MGLTDLGRYLICVNAQKNQRTVTDQAMDPFCADIAVLRDKLIVKFLFYYCFYCSFMYNMVRESRCVKHRLFQAVKCLQFAGYYQITTKKEKRLM